MDPSFHARLLVPFLAGTLAMFSACSSVDKVQGRDCGTAGTFGAKHDAGWGGAGTDPKAGCGGALEDDEDAGTLDSGGSTGTLCGSRATDGGETDACVQGRPILTNEVLNARDLGGTPLENGATVACGKLYRAGALANLTDNGCEQFDRLGIRTVVDLRVASERLAAPEAACVQESAHIVLAPLPVPYNVSPEDYIADLNAAESVAVAFNALASKAAYPVCFHCTYGRDRTGVLTAVILLALGATREAVTVEYELSREAGVGSYPDSLEAVLDEIERRGGIAAYLARVGVSGDQLTALRAQAIAP